jgi:hypothetical protein
VSRKKYFWLCNTEENIEQFSYFQEFFSGAGGFSCFFHVLPGGLTRNAKQHFMVCFGFVTLPCGNDSVQYSFIYSSKACIAAMYSSLATNIFIQNFFNIAG